MQTSIRNFEMLLNPRHQWVVPVYQRHYKWSTDKQIPKLWEELEEQTVRRLENQNVYPHYFGALICTQQITTDFGVVPNRYLVDGQQRITTFNLLLTAIREVARDRKVEDLTRKIDAYLLNVQDDNMQNLDREQHKLWPSHYDRSLYIDIVKNSMQEFRQLRSNLFYKNGNLYQGMAPNMLRAYWYFYEKIARLIGEQRENSVTAQQLLESLLTSFLGGFQIVLIELDGDDDAQEIFASLNGLGEELSPFDLIRNYIFHRAQNTKEDHDQLFEQHWADYEEPFWSASVRQGRYRKERADHLIAHSVVAETGREINITKIFVEYQRYSTEAAYANVEDELAVLREHADAYRALEELPAGHPTAEIARVFRIWDISTFHPLILWINRYIGNLEHKRYLYKLIESYLIRREICGLSTKNYNKVVAMLIQRTKNEPDKFKSMVENIASLKGSASGMPDDEAVGQAVMHDPIYKLSSANQIRYILEKIERSKRSTLNEPIGKLDELTIEHIMPQSWAEHWPLENRIKVPYESEYRFMIEKIDVDDETLELLRKRNRAIQTLGNLTIVTRARNSKLRNGPWEEKRTQFSDSSLVMNKDIASREIWDESRIEQRAHQITEIVNRLWQKQ